MIKVLVTSVGGGVGQSIVDSLSCFKEQYFIVGLDISENVFSRNQCDKFILSKRINESDYLSFLLEICAEHKIDVLIPGNDGELVLLSNNISLFSDINVKVIVSPTKIVVSSRNKYEWYRDYSKIINIVPTVLLQEYLTDPSKHNSITFPAIAKPAAGSASSGIRIYLSQDEVSDDIVNVVNPNDYVIQPYLFPQDNDPDYSAISKAVSSRVLLQVSEISCQIVYSEDSEVLGIFISKNSLKNGIPVTIEPLDEPEIYSIVSNIAESLKSENVVGPVNIQGRLTDQGLVFFEMNLRFTGITGNRSQFGFNEVVSVVESFVNNRHILLGKPNRNRIGARQVACRTFYPLDNKKIDTILVTGASSWAARNVLNYLRDNYGLDEKKVFLSSRNPKGLQDEFRKSSNYNSKIKFIGTSELELSHALASSDVIINFASARPPGNTNDFLQATKFNMLLVNLISKSNVGLVLNMSSQSVYQRNSGVEQSELSPVRADSDYSFSKLLVEDAFSKIITNSTNTTVINLRLSRLWGGSLLLDKKQLPFRMIDSLFGSQKTVLNNSQNEMNLIDIDDVSSFIINIFNNWLVDASLPNIINVSNHNITLQQLADTLKSACEGREINIDSLVVMKKACSDDSLTLINNKSVELGFKSSNTLEVSWRKMIDMYLS